jgi:hypothetical protein
MFLVDWYNATAEDLFAADRFPSLREEVRQKQADDAALPTKTLSRSARTVPLPA